VRFVELFDCTAAVQVANFLKQNLGPCGHVQDEFDDV
jgi:hypothetical protein